MCPAYKQQWQLDLENIRRKRFGEPELPDPPDPSRRTPRSAARREADREHARKSYERGRANEQRLLQAVLQCGFDWIASVRLATSQEDHQGIDIVVTTDVGDLYLQSKSSVTGCRDFKNKRPDATHIEVILVADSEDRAIREKDGIGWRGSHGLIERTQAALLRLRGAKLISG